MRMGQGVRTGSGHGGITCVLQTQFSSFQYEIEFSVIHKHQHDSTTYENTVKPVLRGHPREGQKVAA